MPPHTLAVIGCTKPNLALAQAAVDCGLQVSACVDASESRARRAALRFNTVPLKRIDETLGLADILLLAPSPRTSAKKTDSVHEPFACSNRRDSVLLPYNDFPFHAQLNALVRQVRAGAIGTPGFIRVRYGTTPDAFEAGPRFLLNWLLRIAPNPASVFAQQVERGHRAAQLIATFTHSDGSIAQINLSSQRGAETRLEAEVVGSAGIVACDTRDEVLAVRPAAAARGALDSRKRHAFWRGFLDVFDDPDFTTRAVAHRNLLAKRVLRRMARSVTAGKPVHIEGLGQ